MKVGKLEIKHFKKTILATTMIIGTSVILFQAFTQAVIAAEYSKKNIIPTTYANSTNQLSSTPTQSSLSEGYKKANYIIRNINLEYFKNQTPTSKDMTKEAAAEIGAQALWRIYGLNLEGQVIEMGYHEPTDSIPRSRWYADVLIDDELSYCFEVDSVTGDLFAVNHSRVLDVDIPVTFDSALAQNPQEYVLLAKQTANNLNVVHSQVASVQYNCQGYSNNDPDITFDIKGENGEVAQMTFSRYDQALLGISYSVGYQYTLETIKKIEQEMESIDTQTQETSQPPSLLPILEE